MLNLRSALLRSLQATSSSSIAARTTRSFISISSPSTSPSCHSSLSRPQRSAISLQALRRTYATDGEQATKEQFESAGKSVSSTSYDSPTTGGKDVASEANSSHESFATEVKEKVSASVASVRAVASGARDAASGFVGHASQGFGNSPVFRQRRDRETIIEPSPEEAKGHMYMSNLFFDLTEQDLERELTAFGPVRSVRIIRDMNGLSKGFGYAQMERVEDAVNARNSMEGKLIEGRRLIIQHSVDKMAGRRRSNTPTETFNNPPSKTLFIGNMSYDMTNDDLTELFKDIKNVLDVRVAVDRRTGQPRGFAHAEFEDIASAEAAAEYLKTLTPHGRRLKLDFSTAKVY